MSVGSFIGFVCIWLYLGIGHLGFKIGVQHLKEDFPIYYDVLASNKGSLFTAYIFFVVFWFPLVIGVLIERGIKKVFSDNNNDNDKEEDNKDV